MELKAQRRFWDVILKVCQDNLISEMRSILASLNENVLEKYKSTTANL